MGSLEIWGSDKHVLELSLLLGQQLTLLLIFPSHENVNNFILSSNST